MLKIIGLSGDGETTRRTKIEQTSATENQVPENQKSTYQVFDQKGKPLGSQIKAVSRDAAKILGNVPRGGRIEEVL